MKFRIFWIGSNADTEFRGAIERYRSRIEHFFPIEITELAPEKGRQKANETSIIHAESARLLEAIPAQGQVVVLDERGKAMGSLEFATWLGEVVSRNPHGLSFLMGGDLGLSDSVRKRADRILSLSAMTLPHQIARVVLLEQIYRACTIMRNIRYHK
ncbi:MAG: 23S rRNA (pseudouridine(1915)-N(3))-methyltransferase RlmH [Acidobacteriota bacterium]